MQSIARLPNVGLNDYQPAKPKPTITIACKIVELPYMGPHKFDDAAHRPYPTEELKLKAETKSEDLSDPCERLIEKVASLASILSCSESDAQHILFNNM